jgi:lipid-binding SYLF domain-containing protein
MALVAALRREGLELIATVTLEEIERRVLGAKPARSEVGPYPERRKPMRSMKVITALTIAVALAATPALARHGMKKSDRFVLEESTAVLNQLTTAPDDAIPESLLRRAECVLVFPHVTKGAFIVGGRYGRGVVVCRDGGGDDFGAPAFFSLGGPSIGWQWGGQQTDFVLLVMNEDGMENLLEDRFTLGGNASVAAGPVGRTTEAATDAQAEAQILSWSRSQGLFAGVSLEGAVIQPSEKANARLYDRNVTVRPILKGEVSPVPQEAKDFVALARRVAARDSETASNR